jgi:hypothetical protein
LDGPVVSDHVVPDSENNRRAQVCCLATSWRAYLDHLTEDKRQAGISTTDARRAACIQ